MASDDYLLEAVAGALQGFNSVYTPREQAEFQDSLTRRRAQEEKEAEFDLYQKKLPIQEESQIRIAQASRVPQQMTEIVDNQGNLIRTTKNKVERLAPPRFGTGFSPGETAIDRDFGKEYSDYIASGGFTSSRKNISQLEGVSKELENTDSATGGVVGILPKFARDIVTPKGAALQDEVEEVVQTNLRQILGAQFTEKEGERLVSRAYNPRQSEEVNKRRVDRLILQIKDAAKAKDEAVKYFEKNGTLKGFQGKLYNSANDFLQDGNLAEPSFEKSNEAPKVGGTFNGQKIKNVRRVR